MQRGDVAFAYEHARLALRAIGAATNIDSGHANDAAVGTRAASDADLGSVVGIFEDFMHFAPVSKRGETAVVRHAVKAARARAEGLVLDRHALERAPDSCSVLMLKTAFCGEGAGGVEGSAPGLVIDVHRERTLFRAVKLVAAAECIMAEHVLWLVEGSASLLRSLLPGAGSSASGELWTLMFMTHLCSVLKDLHEHVPRVRVDATESAGQVAPHALEAVFISCSGLVQAGDADAARLSLAALVAVSEVCDANTVSMLLLRNKGLPSLLRAVARMPHSTVHDAMLAVLRQLTLTQASDAAGACDTLVGHAVSMLHRDDLTSQARFGVQALQQILHSSKASTGAGHVSTLDPLHAARVIEFAASIDLHTALAAGILGQCLTLVCGYGKATVGHGGHPTLC